jgi:hypothetical protein
MRRVWWGSASAVENVAGWRRGGTVLRRVKTAWTTVLGVLRKLFFSPFLRRQAACDTANAAASLL